MNLQQVIVLGALALSTLCVLEAKEGNGATSDGGTHVYLLHNQAFNLLKDSFREFGMLTIAKGADVSTDEVPFPMVAATAGGMLYVGSERKWAQRRVLYLLAENNTPGRPGFSIALQNLRPMSPEARATVIDFRELKPWLVIANSSAVDAEAGQEVMIALKGRTPAGSYRESARMKKAANNWTATVVFLSLATEVEASIEVYEKPGGAFGQRRSLGTTNVRRNPTKLKFVDVSFVRQD